MCVSGYKFKKYKDLKNVVSIDLIEKDVHFIYEYFIHSEAKALLSREYDTVFEKMQLSVKGKNNDESINYCTGI